MDKWAYRAGERVMESAEDLNKKLRKLKGHTRENPVFQSLGSKQTEASQGTSQPPVDQGATQKPSRNVTKPNQNKVFGMTQEEWNAQPDYIKNRYMQGWGLNGYNEKIRTGDPNVLINWQIPENEGPSLSDKILGRSTPPMSAPQANPMSVEEVRGMNLTQRDIGGGQAIGPWGRVPGQEENRTRVYDSMGRKTYDSEVWDKYVPEFMQGNLNRENEIQKSNIDASARLGVADRNAAASMYSSNNYLKAAQLRGEQQGRDPYKVATDELGYVQKALSNVDPMAPPEEKARTANQASLEFRMRTEPGRIQEGQNRKDNTVIYRDTQTGQVFDQQGNDITNKFRDAGPGPQSSIGPQINPARGMDPTREMNQNVYNAQQQALEGQKLVSSNRNKIRSWMDDWQGRSDWRLS